MNKTVDTEIYKVTVYDDQALVMRRGIVQLTGEERELIVAQLPMTLVSESVQVSGTGKAGVRLLGVRTEKTATPEAVHPKVTQLSEDIKQLEEQKHHGQDVLTLLNLQRNFVKNLINQYQERLTKLPNPEPLNINQIKDLLDFVGEQWQSLSSAIAQQDREQKQISNQLQAQRSQLQQLSTPHTQESFNIIISLEPSGADELELEVSYTVTQASWQPHYDLRWQDTGQTVHLSYFAQVTQTTGEDWQGVALTLSTTQPRLDRLPSQLIPWYIDLKQPSDRSRAKSERSPLMTMPFAGAAPEPEPTIEKELELLKGEGAVTKISKQKSIVTFAVTEQGDIPSDGTSHKLKIGSVEYPCRLEYIAMPQRANFAYLQATITNPLDGVTLLPGQANLFRDNTFIGTIDIETIAPGRDLKVDFGIDDGLKVERYLVERQIDKKLVGNQQRTIATHAYRLVITNIGEQQAEVKVTELLPVSCHPQLKVRLTDSEPQVQNTETGVLEWSVKLLPLSCQELYYEFAIDYPPEFKVLGLEV